MAVEVDDSVDEKEIHQLKTKCVPVSQNISSRDFLPSNITTDYLESSNQDLLQRNGHSQEDSDKIPSNQKPQEFSRSDGFLAVELSEDLLNPQNLKTEKRCHVSSDDVPKSPDPILYPETEPTKDNNTKRINTSTPSLSQAVANQSPKVQNTWHDKMSNALPLVAELPKMEMSYPPAKTITSLQMPGVKYTPDILPKGMPINGPPIHMNRVILNDCHNATIGSVIENKGDMVLNQYVDLRNGSISPDEQITVTDSLNEETSWCMKKKHLWAFGALCLVLVAVITSVYFAFLDTEEQEEEVSDPGANAPANYTLRVIPRSQWSFHTEKPLNDLLIRPARYVILAHTAGSPCEKSITCINIVRSVESWHLQSGSKGGTGYNFLIGGDGYIYEGRGWGKYGAHTIGFNCNSIGVAFIGNFDEVILTASMVEALEILLEEGLRRGELTLDFKLMGHNQVRSMSSPGLNVINKMQTFPHWGTRTPKDYNLCPVL